MKIVAKNTQQINQDLVANSIKNEVSQLGSQNNLPSFQERLSDGLENVAKVQSSAAELAKNFELGTENDLAKVMVGQQVSSLAFQLTLNVRNKALSAYKDIMNMPV